MYLYIKKHKRLYGALGNIEYTPTNQPDVKIL